MQVVYFLVQTGLWWIFHLSAVFYGVQFPFHSRSFKASNRSKYVHVIMVVIALLLPLVPVISCAVIGGYSMTSFPPIVCTGSDTDATYYSLVLPNIIILGIGASLLLLIFWAVHKVKYIMFS